MISKHSFSKKPCNFKNTWGSHMDKNGSRIMATSGMQIMSNETAESNFGLCLDTETHHIKAILHARRFALPSKSNKHISPFAQYVGASAQCDLCGLPHLVGYARFASFRA